MSTVGRRFVTYHPSAVLRADDRAAEVRAASDRRPEGWLDAAATGWWRSARGNRGTIGGLTFGSPVDEGVTVAEIEGFCNAPFEKLVDVLSAHARQRRRPRRVGGRHRRGRDRRRLLGRLGRRRRGPRRGSADTIVNVLVDHQDDDVACRAGAGRPWRARRRTRRWPLLAGVRRQRQGRHSRCAT